MAREGDKNTSQDRRSGQDGTRGTHQWKSTAGNKAANNPQNQNPANRAPAAKIPSASSTLRPSAPAWGKQAAPPSSTSGMQYLKTTTSSASNQPSVQTATTPSPSTGATTSWAALLGGGATTPATPKVAARDETNNTNTAVNTHEEPQPASTAMSEAPKHTLNTSSPSSPKSFSFQRGNGVVLVHEAPAPVATVPTVAAVVVEQQDSEISSSQNEGAVTASIKSIPNEAKSTPLSWAEKARLAAAHPPPSSPPSARKASIAAAVASPSKHNSATAHGKSPKRGQEGSNQHHHHRKEQQQQQSNKSGQRQAFEKGGKREQQPGKNKSTNNQVVQAKISTKKSSVEIHSPKLLPVLEPEPELPLAIVEEDKDKQENKDAKTDNTVQPLAEPDASPSIITSSASPPRPSEDIKEALDILCSSLASWRLPQTDVSSSSSSSSSSPSQQHRVQPRGIKNPGNLCFVNAVLQGLMGSTSFCRILLALRSLALNSEKKEFVDSENFPVLAAMVQIAVQFQKRPENDVPVADPKKNTITGDSISNKSENNPVMVLGGHPVSSALIMELINQFTPRQQDNNSKTREEGRVEQEDAHEFLHFLLDKMDSELVALRKMVEKEKTSSVNNQKSVDGDGEQFQQDEAVVIPLENGFDDDGWLVKSGKKSVRQQEVSAGASNEAASVITSLFQGKFATSVACAGAPNSVTVHPFMIVELPIYSDNIRSISDSLDALTAAEVLEGYKPATGAIPQQAAKTERFLHLPDVFVLHLMRFQYTGKSAKISKYVSFEPRLAMRSSWMASGTPDRGAIYNLVATVTHHGKSISRGHYTADVVQPDRKWLRFDDSDVYMVKEQQVLGDTPYLLVYERQR